MEKTMDDWLYDTKELLTEFAHDLAAPGSETRALRTRMAYPGPEVEPGDLVVFEVGASRSDGDSWFVVKSWHDGTERYSITQTPSQREEVRGRVLFVVRQWEEPADEES
jgi:hypothetical protein